MKFKTRRYYLYYLARLAAFLFSVIPVSVGLKIAEILGRIIFACLVKYRAIAIANLKSAFGKERGEEELAKVAKGVFENLSKNAVELVNFPKINKANLNRFVRIENIDIVDTALKAGKGVILLTGHFGNWELLALAFRLKGYEGAVIGRRIYFDKYDKYLNGLRQFHDVNIIYRDESPKKIIRALRENKIIGILADQDVDSVDGVFANFFGQAAYTPSGPVLLAKASGAALIPAFAIRKNGRHTIMVEKPVELVDTGDKEADLVRNTEKWSNILESYIRRYPDHWVWMHRRWKTREN